MERRIAALITTGEEGVSYSEAAAALKKQLNARRSNSRNGQIPALEREIEADEAALGELRTLLSERSEAEETLAALRETEAALRADLTTHDLADRQKQYIDREHAKRDAENADREARVFRRMLADSDVPSREALEENRGRLRTVEDLERQQRDAASKRQDAELALSQFDAAAKVSLLRPIATVWLLCLILCAALPPAAILLSLSVPTAVLYGAAGAVVLFAVLFVLEWTRAREKKRLRVQERSELEAALREAETACSVLKSQIDKTMALVYAAIPAGDAVSASTYVHSNLARYDTLAQMEAAARSKRQYYENFPKPELTDVPVRPIERPERSRQTLQYELDRTVERRGEAQSRADYTTGRLQAIGDAGELEASLAQKRERLTELLGEYDAIALAMETLERANTALQNRFSPELGKRAAMYFSALTGGKYEAVALDRTFRALAVESGNSVARDAALLSQGASDQLYLAVRLAICDMVLPEEKPVPLVLDNALINFDDARCEAALELLVKAAETRQILLLTCRHRETAYIKDRENVHILTL